MWFKKKNFERDWMNEIDFRWQRVASHYDADKHAFVYLTEPSLQYRRGFRGTWQTVSEHTEIMTPAKAPNA